jgi:hypothetical protein
VETNASTRFNVASDQVSTELDGEVVILSIRSGGYYSLRNVSARIWALIHKPRSVAEIRNIVAAEYHTDAERVEADAIEFLESLAELGLAEVIE